MGSRITATLATSMLLSVMLAPSGAYHISGDGASEFPGADSYDWTVGAGSNTIVFCEGDGNEAAPDNQGDGFTGINGLCNMAHNGASRSDGTYPNGDAARADTTLTRAHVDAIDVDEWLVFDMCQYAATLGDPTVPDTSACDIDVGWAASYDFAGCDVAAGEKFAIRHVFLAWADLGHLTGFVDGVSFTDNVLAGTSLGGSYTVSETATQHHNDDIDPHHCENVPGNHPVAVVGKKDEPTSCSGHRSVHPDAPPGERDFMSGTCFLPGGRQVPMKQIGNEEALVRSLEYGAPGACHDQDVEVMASLSSGMNFVESEIKCDGVTVAGGFPAGRDSAADGIPVINAGTKPDDETDYVCKITFEWDGMAIYSATGSCRDVD